MPFVKLTSICRAVLPSGETVVFDDWVYNDKIIFAVKEVGTGSRAGQLLLGQGLWEVNRNKASEDINSWVYEKDVIFV